MPALVQIDCVVKDERLSPYECIVRLGGPNTPGVPAPDESAFASTLRKRGLAVAVGSRWSLSVHDAIEGLLEGKWTFFIEFGGRDIMTVEVAKGPTGALYLKTAVDADTPDHLLFMPECRL